MGKQAIFFDLLQMLVENGCIASVARVSVIHGNRADVKDG